MYLSEAGRDCCCHSLNTKITLHDMIYKDSVRNSQGTQCCVGRDIIGVCGKNYTEPINILRGQNAEMLALNLAVHVITTRF
jgi:hypothetical protein